MLNNMFFVFFLLVPTLSLGSPGKIGNGGDAVECHGTGPGQFSGLYALDYLLTFRSDAEDLAPSKSMDESLNRIETLIRTKLPELAVGFHDFRSLIRNTSWTKPRVWIEAPFGLMTLPDGPIVSQFPPECLDGAGKGKIIQAFVQQAPGVGGAPAGKTVYRWIPSIFQKLEQTAPNQATFLLVHEWLWDYSSNVEVNRHVVRLLHSKEASSMTRDELVAELKGMGFPLPQSTAFARATINVRYAKTGIQRDVFDCSLMEIYTHWDVPGAGVKFSCEGGQVLFLAYVRASNPTRAELVVIYADMSSAAPPEFRGKYTTIMPPIINLKDQPIKPGAQLRIPIVDVIPLSEQAKGVVLNGTVEITLPMK